MKFAVQTNPHAFHNATNKYNNDRYQVEANGDGSYNTQDDNYKQRHTYDRRHLPDSSENHFDHRTKHFSEGVGHAVIRTRPTNESNRYKEFIVEMDRLYPTTKWPLHSKWSFWYIKNDRSKKDWKENLIKLIDISYIEDFWAMFKHLVQPSNLETGADLALFKTGIEPMWEDAENKNGGRWLLTFNAQSRKTNELDEIWLNSILALIGDNFCGTCDKDKDDEHLCEGITGLCVQNRPKIDKLSLWTKDCKNEQSTRLIGKKWKENVDIQKMSITFEPHDSQHSKGSTSKFLYKE